jgi:hypothetical protein
MHPFKPFVIVFADICADRSVPWIAYKILNPRAIRGGSSTPAEIYSKPPSELLSRVIFHLKTAKMGIWSRVLREILAYNADCMQDSSASAYIVRNKQGV